MPEDAAELDAFATLPEDAAALRRGDNEEDDDDEETGNDRSSAALSASSHRACCRGQPRRPQARPQRYYNESPFDRRWPLLPPPVPSGILTKGNEKKEKKTW